MPPSNRWLMIMVLLFTWHQIGHSIEPPKYSSIRTSLADQVATNTVTVDASTTNAPATSDNRPIKSANNKSHPLVRPQKSPTTASPANQPHDNRLDKSPDKLEESSTLSPPDPSLNLFLSSSARTIASINNSNESLSNKAIINSSFASESQTAEANSSSPASKLPMPGSSLSASKLAESAAAPTNTERTPGDGSSRNEKSIPPSSTVQRLQFDNIHGGFLLINPISSNVSSKTNKDESTTSNHIENRASLGHSKQQRPAARSTSLKVPLNAKLELSSPASPPDSSNASLIGAHKSANDGTKSERGSAMRLQNAAKQASFSKYSGEKDSSGLRQRTESPAASTVNAPAIATAVLGNDGAPFQAPATKETKVSSSSTSKFSKTTKHLTTMQPTQSSSGISQAGSIEPAKSKQINKLSTLIETSSFSDHRAAEAAKSDLTAANAANVNKINHFDSTNENVNFPGTNRSANSEVGSGSAAFPNVAPHSVLIGSNELNQFKSAVVKKDTKQQQIDYETQPASVNIVSPEEDKLCYEENGWPTTECSESAVSNCTFPYSGVTYRLCYSSCQWGKVDTSQCKLSSLAEIHNLILYHVHKHLIDGLYPLADELAKVICSSSSPILSPIDRIDAFDALNAIFNSAALNVHFDTAEPEQRRRELSFVKSILKVANALVTNPIVFETETEKNSLITFKTTETLLGLRRLLENVCRALIVQNEQNNAVDVEEVRQVPLLDGGQASNLALMLIHRTRAGKLLTLFSNEPQLPGANRLPHTALHLEELKNRDAGIAILSVNNLPRGGYTQSGKWTILANPLLVTIVPAISIVVDFEQTPTVNVEFTFLDHFVPFSQPVYCVRLANASKNSWTRSKCVLVRRNATSAQCACSVMGYLTVVASRGSGQRETDAFGNYHQSYASKLHKTLFISSAASSLVILFTIAYSLLANLLRHSRSARRPLVEPATQSIKTADQQKWTTSDRSNDKAAFNLSESRHSLKADNQLLKELSKPPCHRLAYTPQYCTQTQLNWLVLICLFVAIQLFWLSGVLFPGDQFTIFTLWNKLWNKYRGQSQLKPIFISSSWSLNLQSQANHLINFMDGQQSCLNVALILHFLFTSCALLMLLNTLHLYRHLRKSKLNDLKFDPLLFGYSARPFPFNCCSFNYAKSTESLISRQNGGASESDESDPANNQISSIEQLVEELNQKDLDENNAKDLSSARKESARQQADNLINSRKSSRKPNRPISCSPSKLPKSKKLSRAALGQKVAVLLAQAKKYSRHLNTFACYCLCGITAAFITLLTYKLNPAGYETRRYCWMSIEGGITFSFIVPVSVGIVLNTVLILLALRQFLHLKRVHQQARSESVYDSPLQGELVNSYHPSQFTCINKMCKFNFIFRSTYFNINLLVCTLPAFAVYWTFSVLALEQMHTSAFQFIFALLNFLFSCCLLLLNLPYVKDTVLHSDYLSSAIQDDQLISEELSPEDDLIEEELIIYVECADEENLE